MGENHIPRIVTTISFAIVIILLTVIFSYSYLLMKLVTEKENLAEQLIKVRLQLEEEQEKRFLTQQDKNKLLKEIQSLRVQLQQTEEKQCPTIQVTETQVEPSPEEEILVCRVEHKQINFKLIRKAVLKTLSNNSSDRFEGFSVLMNNLDYITEHEQRQLIQFYLDRISPSNPEGVYYAAFIISELKPAVLKEYEQQLQEAYQFIFYKPGWEHTSYRYCQIESKLNGYFP